MRRLLHSGTDQRKTPVGGWALVLSFIFLLTAGCAAQQPPYRPALEEDGALYLYLQPLPQEAHRLAFTLANIAAVREDGTHIPLLAAPKRLQGDELAATQQRLAAARLAPGRYQGLAITVTNAAVRSQQGQAALLAPPEPILIGQQFEIEREKTLALFLSLELEKLIRNGYSFTPTFTLAAPSRHLADLMGFATIPEKNLVMVFNKRTMEIVEIVASGSGPQGLALDQKRGRVYVALAGEDAVQVIDVATGETTGRIRLQFHDEPVALALSADGRTLLSANAGSNTASLIDTDGLFERDRVRFDAEPSWVVTEPRGNRAYFFHPLSNAISVVSLARNERVTTRTLEESPVKGAFSPEGDRLYVISPRSPNLLAVDPASLGVAQRIFIGGGAAAIRVDPQSGLVYIGKLSGEIMVVAPSSRMFIDSYRVGGAVGFLTIDKEENSLLAALPEEKGLLKIDLVGKQVQQITDMEGEIHSIGVMGEK